VQSKKGYVNFMNIEYRVTPKELASMVGASSTSVRTWVNSYKFNKFVFYDNGLGDKQKLNILINKEFCKVFIPYLAQKDVYNKKKYVANFNKSMIDMKLL